MIHDVYCDEDGILEFLGFLRELEFFKESWYFGVFGVFRFIWKLRPRP